MTSLSIVETLSVPLILIEAEEIKVCLGHQEFGGEYKKRESAKVAGFKWLNENQKDPTIKNCSFEIEDKHKKSKRLFYNYTHVNDVKSCNHCQIKVVRNILELVSKDHFEQP